MCEACVLDHTRLKHTPPMPHSVDLPDACTLCGQPISHEQQAQAQLVANKLGTATMRNAHDVTTIVTATSNVLLVGHNPTGMIDAVYQGPIRLAFNHWLCDRCRKRHATRDTWRPLAGAVQRGVEEWWSPPAG